MNIDFYLSEMSASDKHGGGLTLHRVLGDDLKKISYFIHTNRFADDIPVAAHLADKCFSKHNIWEHNAVRRITGRTFAARMRKRTSVIKRHALKTARHIHKEITQTDTVRGLVCPQGADTLYTLAELQKLRPVRYITWVMDDHLVEYKNGEWRYPEDIEQLFAAHLQGAVQVLVISPAMQAFYKARFGVESTVVFGPADSNGIAHLPKVVTTDEKLRIGYFGAVAAWQTDVLQAVAESIQHTDAALDIYSGATTPPQDVLLPGVNFKGRIEASAVLQTMQQYHALLLPIGFSEGVRNMSAFNIATKMSECLASGVPVLAIGPSYAAMAAYLKQHQAAIVVESNQPQDISAVLASWRNYQLLKEVLDNAARLEATETGTVPMRKKWLKALQCLTQL